MTVQFMKSREVKQALKLNPLKGGQKNSGWKSEECRNRLEAYPPMRFAWAN